MPDLIVPYTTRWSAEDRDWLAVDPHGDGLVSHMVEERIGEGRPLWREVHPSRMRRAVALRLCMVCGKKVSPHYAAIIPLGEWKDCREQRRFALVGNVMHVGCAAKAVQSCPAIGKAKLSWVKLPTSAAQRSRNIVFRKWPGGPVDHVRIALTETDAIRLIKRAGTVKAPRHDPA